MSPASASPASTSPAISPATSTNIPKISFHEPTGHRRFSQISHGSGAIEEEDDDEDHAQDWSVKIPDDETWAAKERRRSSVWNKVTPGYPTVKPKTPSGSFSSDGEKRGSILSLWSHGKDAKGNDVLHSGENVEHWDGNADEIQRLAAEKEAEKQRVKLEKLQRVKEMEAQADRMREEADKLRAEARELDKEDIVVVSDVQVQRRSFDKGLSPTTSRDSRERSDRKGSVLGIWKGGKDEFGNDVIHSG